MLPRAKAILISLVGLVSLSACQSTTNLALDPQPQTINAQNEPDYFLVTSKYLLSKVEDTATKWEASARLIRTEAINVDNKGKADWVYYFKSPSKTKILRIDSECNAIEMGNNLLGSQIELSSWTMDSDKAIEIAQKNGLKHFPVDEMFLEKTTANPQWELNSDDGSFKVDAKTGFVIKREKKK